MSRYRSKTSAGGEFGLSTGEQVPSGWVAQRMETNSGIGGGSQSSQYAHTWDDSVPRGAIRRRWHVHSHHHWDRVQDRRYHYYPGMCGFHSSNCRHPCYSHFLRPDLFSEEVAPPLNLRGSAEKYVPRVLTDVARQPTKAAILAVLQQYIWSRGEGFCQTFFGSPDMLPNYGKFCVCVLGDCSVKPLTTLPAKTEDYLCGWCARALETLERILQRRKEVARP